MNFQRILVATDFSAASLVAVETAFNLALEGSETMYLLNVIQKHAIVDQMGHIYPSFRKRYGDARERFRKGYGEARERLYALIPEQSKHDSKVKTLVLTEASPAQAIARFARIKDVDLIIIGAHGRKGLRPLSMGSTAESLLRRSPCKVLVVKQKIASNAA